MAVAVCWLASATASKLALARSQGRNFQVAVELRITAPLPSRKSLGVPVLHGMVLFSPRIKVPQIESSKLNCHIGLARRLGPDQAEIGIYTTQLPHSVYTTTDMGNIQARYIQVCYLPLKSGREEPHDLRSWRKPISKRCCTSLYIFGLIYSWDLAPIKSKEDISARCLFCHACEGRVPARDSH